MGIEAYKPLRNTIDVVVLTTANKENTDERKVPQRGIQILLVKRENEPFDGCWVLPGGFVDYDKPLDDCVRDKLEQKTGLRDTYFEQLYTYGNDVYRDPRDRVITVAYTALLNKDEVDQGKLNNNTAWFWIDINRDSDGLVESVEFTQVDKYGSGEKVRDLGFDHSKIIIDSLNRISNKAMYTDILFNALPKRFTVKELEYTFEAFIGKSIPGFRRIISGRIAETPYTTSDVNAKPNSFRPARLYTLASKTY